MYLDPDVVIDTALYHLWSICIWALCTAFLGFLVPFVLRRATKRPHSAQPIVWISLAAWLLYTGLTCRWRYALYSIDAEDPKTAEFAYESLLKIPDIDMGLALAVDPRQWDTVRFYASCKVADMLVTKNRAALKAALSRTAAAKPVSPVFYGTNAINEIFWSTTPGPYSVGEIIQKRLTYMSKSKGLSGGAGTN